MVCEFLIMRDNTAVAHNPGEEVLDGVALSGELASEATWPATIGLVEVHFDVRAGQTSEPVPQRLRQLPTFSGNHGATTMRHLERQLPTV
jgi:hypothetical protein